MKNLIKLVSLLAFAIGLSAIVPKGAHADWRNCAPSEIMEFSNRIHVRCKTAVPLPGSSSPTISFFAISTANVGMAARFLAMANAAMVANKNFTADIPAAASTVTNCSASNCRTPVAFGILD